jgi:hypothetical protein
MESRRRRLKQLLDKLMEKIRYWNFREQALYRAVWRTCFGKALDLSQDGPSNKTYSVCYISVRVLILWLAIFILGQHARAQELNWIELIFIITAGNSYRAACKCEVPVVKTKANGVVEFSPILLNLGINRGEWSVSHSGRFFFENEYLVTT